MKTSKTEFSLFQKSMEA